VRVKSDFLPAQLVSNNVVDSANVDNAILEFVSKSNKSQSTKKVSERNTLTAKTVRSLHNGHVVTANEQVSRAEPVSESDDCDEDGAKLKKGSRKGGVTIGRGSDIRGPDISTPEVTESKAKALVRGIGDKNTVKRCPGGETHNGDEVPSRDEQTNRVQIM
jgi:hypothetical protein